jgi:hypothetical protein
LRIPASEDEDNQGKENQNSASIDGIPISVHYPIVSWSYEPMKLLCFLTKARAGPQVVKVMDVSKLPRETQLELVNLPIDNFTHDSFGESLVGHIRINFEKT